jgi:hypothetical protein
MNILMRSSFPAIIDLTRAVSSMVRVAVSICFCRVPWLLVDVVFRELDLLWLKAEISCDYEMSLMLSPVFISTWECLWCVGMEALYFEYCEIMETWVGIAPVN